MPRKINLIALLHRQQAHNRKIVRGLIAQQKKAARPKKKPKQAQAPKPPQPAAVQQRGAGKPANNTTCDIFWVGNDLPAAADVNGVAFCLQAKFAQGQEAGEGDTTFQWTHLGFFDMAVDVRDNWPGAINAYLYVPDVTSVKYGIIMVEVINRGTPAAYKKVYLHREAVTWPTTAT